MKESANKDIFCNFEVITRAAIMVTVTVTVARGLKYYVNLNNLMITRAAIMVTVTAARGA